MTEVAPLEPLHPLHGGLGQEEIDGLWVAEAERRDAEIQAGRAQERPAAEVLNRAERLLR